MERDRSRSASSRRIGGMPKSQLDRERNRGKRRVHATHTPTGCFPLGCIAMRPSEPRKSPNSLPSWTVSVNIINPSASSRTSGSSVSPPKRFATLGTSATSKTFSTIAAVFSRRPQLASSAIRLVSASTCRNLSRSWTRCRQPEKLERLRKATTMQTRPKTCLGIQKMRRPTFPAATCTKKTM